nr:5-formyltetrahydrofolate cyclo-ligase [Rhodomicrobium sp. Az07]
MTEAIHGLDTVSGIKIRLRAQALVRRSEAWIRAGESAAEALAEAGLRLVAALEGRPVVAGYHPFRHELDVVPLLAALHARGYPIALPRSHPERRLTFHAWTPDAPLERRKFGMLEPPETVEELHPSVIFVPLLAFDARGNRLGYGAGFYDVALGTMRADGRVLAVGVAFDEQEFPAIPAEPLDQPLDMVLTPRRLLTCGAS